MFQVYFLIRRLSIIVRIDAEDREVTIDIDGEGVTLDRRIMQNRDL